MHRGRSRLGIGCASAALCALAAVTPPAGEGAGGPPVWNETTLVSRQSAGAGGAGGIGGSSEAAVSADGRYIAFASDSDNLSGADNDGFSNVYLRDTRVGETTLVSRRSAAEGGAGADAISFNASISADGRYVAFASDADNLSAADSDAPLGVDVFVRDLQANTTTLVSRQSAAEGGAGGEEFSNFPSISADGRFVAFVSDADNLSGADVEEVVDVFVRDLEANRTTLVSRASGAGAGGDDVSSFPAISADGRYVAFQSDAENLSAADVAVRDVFIRDLASGETTLISRQSDSAGGDGGDGSSFLAAISADGRHVAFDSGADNLDPASNDVFTNVFVSGAADPPAIDLSGKKRQRLGEPVKLKVSCDERCSVLATGTARPQGTAEHDKRAKPLKLKRDEAELRADQQGKLKLAPSRRAARRLERAAKASVKITVSATDLAGNTTQAKLKIKLR